MVKLTRIYTKGGDKGKTALGSGKRVVKHHPRVAAYGTVDEANAAVGLARLHTAGLPDPEVDAILSRVQNDLFDLGADLATPEVENPEYPPLRGASLQLMGKLGEGLLRAKFRASRSMTMILTIVRISVITIT